MATSDANGKICLWRDFAVGDNLPSGIGEQFLNCQGHIGWVGAIAFSPDGSIIGSGGGDQNLKLWDTSSGECLKTLKGHYKRVQAVAFSPKGNILASGSDDQTVSLWDLEASNPALRVIRL